MALEHYVAPPYDADSQAVLHQVSVATATRYPKWYAGLDVDGSVDKLRGDLALRTTAIAAELGRRTVVVDDGSSPAFVEALHGVDNTTVAEQVNPGMSIGRQEAFKIAADDEGAKVICWTEPEKVSLVSDGMLGPARAILSGAADIVIPARDAAGFDSYPAVQSDFEQKSNHLFNGILRRHGLYPDDAPDLDMWIGPRFFRNTPELLDLFTRNYEFKGKGLNRLPKDSVGLWPNALFLPVIAALKDGYKVASVPIDYRHPAEQTAQEEGVTGFEDKRAFQQTSILAAVVHFIRRLEGNSRARIQPVGSSV
jgi:hypothetical protein